MFSDDEGSRPRLRGGPDETLEEHWDENLALAQPLAISLAVDGLIVTGTPVLYEGWYQRVCEQQAQLTDKLGHHEQAQAILQEGARRAAIFSQKASVAREANDYVSGADHFHLADVVIRGAGPEALLFSAWRCPRHLVTGWSFGWPSQ